MITKAERAFLLEHLEDIAKNVKLTPIACGVRYRALQKLGFLLEAVGFGKLKNPPPPKEPRKSKKELNFIRELWKGAAALSGKNWKALYNETQKAAGKTPDQKILAD